MSDVIAEIAQTVREGEKMNSLAIRLVLQAIQTGYTLGLAQGQKSA